MPAFKFFISIFIVLAGCAISLRAEQGIAVIDPGKGIQNVSFNVQIATRSSAVFACNNFDKETWSLIGKSSIDFGISSKTKLYKLKLVNFGVENLCLELDKSIIDVINFCIPDSNGNYRYFLTGDSYPSHSKPVPHQNFLFPTGIKSGDTATVFFSVKCSDPLQFSVNAGSHEDFVRKESVVNIFFGSFYGLMFVMILLNLFIYASLRDKSYMHYVLYGLTMIPGFLYLNGYAQRYIWPDLPEINSFAGIFFCAPGVFAITFAYNFLHLKSYSPSSKRIYIGLISAYLITIALNLTGINKPVPYLINVITLIGSGVVIYSGILTYRKGYSPAFYYLTGWGLFIVCIFVFLFKSFGLFPNNLFTENALQTGSALETILFSIALVSRISFYKKEKERAQEETIRLLNEKKEIIKKQNIILEEKVSSRARELQNLNKDLESAIHDLHKTQDQLIHSQKLISLGQFSSGVAHEIQNPLNFVKNFSELSVDLISELLQSPDEESRKIAVQLAENMNAIINHGNRADQVVKSLLYQSKPSNNLRELADINKICRQMALVAYKNMQLKFPEFICNHNDELDSGIPEVSIVIPDMGRVFLNVFNNALYACLQRIKTQANGYQPSISYRSLVADN
ncbi:MAG: hypothetical protein DWQ33_13215 [Bacteroidetes bacterium]|nr:MAG: hypothetical protein DWQ33_13215 [Bacteroidota bacterium]